MRHGMCQIDKERFILVLLDEIDRTVGIIRCKLWLVGVITDNLISVIGRQVREIEYLSLLRMERPHIVWIRQSVIFIETVLQRQELFRIAQMPFTENCGTVSFLLQQLSYRHFVRTDAIIRTRSRSTGKSDTVRIASGQQSGTWSATDRLPGQKMSETDSLCRHTVDIRRFISVCAIIRKIPITGIIEVDDNEVGVVCCKSRYW